MAFEVMTLYSIYVSIITAVILGLVVLVKYRKEKDHDVTSTHDKMGLGLRILIVVLLTIMAVSSTYFIVILFYWGFNTLWNIPASNTVIMYTLYIMWFFEALAFIHGIWKIVKAY
ncbi:MAG: hypothetical protein ACI83O_000500 [Patescibacteria group bacterium]|jgi:hypothetical protein